MPLAPWVIRESARGRCWPYAWAGMTSPVSTLPILARRAEIEDAVRRHQVVVVCGETGSGKTTQLPQICLEMSDASAGLIGHTQPRRLAARAVAARIAEERGEPLGDTVGYKIRFHEKTGRRTRIKVMTDGILLAELASDTGLEAYGTIIIDEAHERSLNIDFLLGYLRTLLPRRPGLRLIVTSATIDPGRFSDYFGGPRAAPVIEVSGRMFPIEMRYQPIAGADEQPDRLDFEAIADAVEGLCDPATRRGDVLVFLPGEREIRLAGDAIARRRVDAEVLPLFSRLTEQAQDRIFHPSAHGRARVILATNVAETSLTVPGIGSVVDTGLARVSRYDPARKIGLLPIEPVSRASANQRAGRCGRVSSGVCIRLYSEASFSQRPAFTEPEIRRTNLAGVILRMKSLGPWLGPVEQFPFLDRPGEQGIKDGYETLFELGALTTHGPEGTLTPIGEQMAQVPLDPRISRMLLGAQPEGSLDEVIVLAAALSIQDPRERPAGRQAEADRAQAVFRHESSDFLTLLNLWDQYSHEADSLSHGALAGWCREHFLSAARMREWGELARQIADVAAELNLRRAPAKAGPDAIHRALLTGLITNIACREGDGSFDYRGVRGNVVQLFPGSTLFRKGPKWIMAAEIVQTTRLYARTVARIDPEWVEELAGHVFQHHRSDFHLDTATGWPSAWERVTMSGIVVVPRRRVPLAPVDPAAARKVFIREALAQCRWDTDEPFMAHNRLAMASARSAEARIRRRDVLAGDEQIVQWFESRVPPSVVEPEGFCAWLALARRTDPSAMMLPPGQLVRPAYMHAFDPGLFPEHIDLGSGEHRTRCTLEYNLAPGKDEDGLTLTAPLLCLADLRGPRPQWLVPGFLPDLVQGLLKTLPKAQRAAIEARAPLPQIAAGCAEVLRSGEGSIADALAEALAVLHGVTIDPVLFAPKALPPHLRPRFCVTGDQGEPLGVDRDLAALSQKLESKYRKARAARDSEGLERRGLTAWDFPELHEVVSIERDGAMVSVYPALVDHGDSVWIVPMDSSRQAAVHTPRGVRRLLAIGCAEEIAYYLEALPPWAEMKRRFGSLGTEPELRDHLTCIIAERAFIDGQPQIRTREQFEERKAACWGRLAVVAREAGDVVARILDHRAFVAHRFSGGTPRLWAASVADLREQAGYLMPRGFLSLLPWERLKRYPIYTEAMRLRLLNLREDGSRPELELIDRFAPHWKRFTAWVAAAMSAQRAAAAHGEGPEAPAPAGGSRKGAAPLPQARRAAPSVNLDAGEWAMQPGRLPPAIEQYRWALEELRLAIFVPELGGDIAIADIEKLWSLAQR